jgi:hypothetical protein
MNYASLYVDMRQLAVQSYRCDSSLSHDAATQIVRRCLENPGYEKVNLTSSLRDVCRDLRRGMDLDPSKSHPGRPISRIRSAGVIPENTPLDDKQVTTLDSEDIIADYFSRHRWYKPALRDLSRFMSARWMSDHYRELRVIFRRTHGKDAV